MQPSAWTLNRGLFFSLLSFHPYWMYLCVCVSLSLTSPNPLGCIVSSFWQPRPSASSLVVFVAHCFFFHSFESCLFNSSMPPSPCLLLPTIHPKKEIHKLYRGYTMRLLYYLNLAKSYLTNHHSTRSNDTPRSHNGWFLVG